MSCLHIESTDSPIPLIQFPHTICINYHCLNDDCEIFSCGVKESDITPSTRQVPSTTTCLQVHVSYPAELCGVGCMWSVACYSIAVDSLYKQAWWEQEVVVQEDIKLNVFKKKILKGIQTLVQSAQEETHVHMTKLSLIHIHAHVHICCIYTSMGRCIC